MDGLEPLPFASGALRAGGFQPPVSPFRAPTVGLDSHPVRRGELAHPGEHGARRGYHGVQGEQVMERDRVDPGIDPSRLQQRLGA